MSDMSVASMEELSAVERQQRMLVLEIAESWVIAKTRYHHMARVKGEGVDCAMYLAAVFEAAGLVPRIEPEPYPPDWHYHRSEEKYLAWIEQYAFPSDGPPLPADVMTFQFGRSISHAGIVKAWPKIYHAYYKVGYVTVSNVEAIPFLATRKRGLWRYKGWRP